MAILHHYCGWWRSSSSDSVASDIRTNRQRNNQRISSTSFSGWRVWSLVTNFQFRVVALRATEPDSFHFFWQEFLPFVIITEQAPQWQMIDNINYIIKILRRLLNIIHNWPVGSVAWYESVLRTSEIWLFFLQLSQIWFLLVWNMFSLYQKLLRAYHDWKDLDSRNHWK